MSREDIFLKIVLILMIIFSLYVMVYAFAVMFDGILSVGTPGKPIAYDCVDGDGGVNLEGLKCEKKVLCSKLGLVAKYKCNSDEWRALK